MVVTNVTPRTGHSPENQSLVLSLWLRGNAAYSFRRALFGAGLVVPAGASRRKFRKSLRFVFVRLRLFKRISFSPHSSTLCGFFVEGVKSREPLSQMGVTRTRLRPCRQRSADSVSPENMVELAGIEPATSSLRTMRSPS
jgi:hypothetical protein